MKSKNLNLLAKLLSESIISEASVPEHGTRIENATDNSLGRGRPPDSVQDSREMASDPSRAKILLKELGASASGDGWAQQIANLFSTSDSHPDFGQLLKDVSLVNNYDNSKEGVFVDLNPGLFEADPKIVYFFIRSLYTAGKNGGMLSIDKPVRCERVVGETAFLFYQGKKAKSFNEEE